MSDEAALLAELAYGPLTHEIGRFANHTKRLVRQVHKHRRALERASEWTDGMAPLDQRPTSAAAAMRAIDQFARRHREDRAHLFGAYFAHHHLRNQAELARIMLSEAECMDAERRILLCREVHARAQADRTEWVSALLECGIRTAAPELSRDDYAAFNVGALTDHEDVDLAIVVANSEARQQMARGFSAVSKTFTRFASKTQLFLSDRLEVAAAGGLTEEYEAVVQQTDRSVVVVMQLLGAQFLSGSTHLARSFEERVTHRFYAQSGVPLAHEGFLRGVMHELRHYRDRAKTASERFSPKREVYLPSKLVIAAVRVIHGVRQPHPPQALLELATKDPERAELYLRLSDAFVQNEVLRALTFLYVIPHDELDFDDPAILAACQHVAYLLGLGTSARRSAETRLLGAYQDIKKRAQSALLELSRHITSHINKVSTFRHLIEQGRQLSATDTNIALRLLVALKRFRGGVFWDEVVELLGDSEDLFIRFLSDLALLEPDTRRSAVQKFLGMMSADAKSLLEFMITIVINEAKAPEAARPVIREGAQLFWEALLELIEHDPVRRETFLLRLDDEAEAEVLFRLAKTYPPSSVSTLARLIERVDPSTRGARVVRSLDAAVILAHHHSHAFDRTISRVLARSPEFLTRLGDAERMRALARKMMTQAARDPVIENQIELLGDAFDIEFLRIALHAILGGPIAECDRDYTEAFDRYARELFKACYREIHPRSPMFELYRPGIGIALFSTGSNGRGQAFSADWDYFAVLAENDGGQKKFFGKVLHRLSSAMARRGIAPHNRFADVFNSYAVSLEELSEHLSRRGQDTFVDEAEILEARFVMGDPAVRRNFQRTLSGRLSGAGGEPFVRDALREIRERQAQHPFGLNLKLGVGGLREINLLALVIQVFVGRSEGPAPLSAALSSFPGQAGALEKLTRIAAELRRLRDAYRLLVAIGPVMEPEYLERIARDLPIALPSVPLGPYVVAQMTESAAAIQELTHAMESALV